MMTITHGVCIFCVLVYFIIGIIYLMMLTYVSDTRRKDPGRWIYAVIWPGSLILDLIYLVSSSSERKDKPPEERKWDRYRIMKKRD